MKRLLLLLSFLLTFFTVQATHMMGADISYQCLGNGKYKIIAKVYRDCRGVPMGTVSFGAFAGTNGGNGCGQYVLGGLSRVSIKDISSRCSTASSPCSPSNTTTGNKGVEEHTFEATVDFNTSPLNNFVNKSTCCEVTFYVNECCRNSGITTGQANQNFYATATINICNLQKMKNKCNNSPQLSNPPIAFICCSQPWYYNNGAIDTVNYDSISYRLVPGLQGLPNNSVTYSSPYSYKIPMTPFCIPPTSISCAPNPSSKPPRGFYFDTTNGDIIVTPIKCDESAVIAIEQTEWRKDTLGVLRWVGKTRRDMQIWVRDDCGYNKTPVIGGPYSHKVCEGDRICFKIKITDEQFLPNQTIPDTVLAKWNKGIPGATFEVVDPKAREKDYEFCWTPAIGMASDVSYSFTVTATDQHCEPPAIAIRSFKIKVNPKPTSKRKYTQLKCGKFAFESYELTSTNSVKWSIRDSVGQKELFYSTKKLDTIKYNYGGRYIIIHTLTSPNNCVTIYRDTVYLTDPPKVVIADNDSFACYGIDFLLKSKIISGQPNFKYKWNNGDTTENILLKNFIKDTTFILSVTDGNNCVFSDTVLTLVKPLPVINLGPDNVICTYQTITIDAQNGDTVKYIWNTGDTTRTITTNLKGSYWVKITDTTFKCVKYDTIQITVNDTVVSNAGPNQSICHLDTFTLNANHKPNLNAKYTWFGLGGNKTYKIKSNIVNNPYSYVLKTEVLQNGITCEDLDTINIRIKPLPLVSWSPKPLKPICYEYGNIWLEQFVNTTHKLGVFDIWNGDLKRNGNITSNFIPYNGRFLFNTISLDNSKLQGGINYNTKVYVRYTDTNGCSNLDSTVQTVYGTPLIKLQSKTVCQDLQFLMMDQLRLIPATKNGVSIVWEVMDAPQGIDTSKLLTNISMGSVPNIRFNFGNPTEDFYQGKYKFRIRVRNLLTSCENTDSVEVTVISEPNVKITSVPDYCVNSGQIINILDYIKVNGNRPVGYNLFFKDVDGDNTDPKVSTNISNGLFNTNTGSGIYKTMFDITELGCKKIDSFIIVVHDTPNLVVTDTTICGTSLPLDILPLVKNNIGGQKEVYVDGRFLSGIPSPNGYQTGPYKMMIVGESQYGCTDTEFVKIKVINQPKLKFIKPISSCELDTIKLLLDTMNLNNGTLTWIKPFGVFGPTFNKKVIPISTDTLKGFIDAEVRFNLSTPKICADVSDTVRIILHKYPNIDFQTYNGCEPLNLSINSKEHKGIDTNYLSYAWSINGSLISNTKNILSTSIPSYGIYSLTLSVSNNRGSKICSTVLTKSVEVYPNPTTIFSTDPLYKTTVALPKFKMINTSSVSQTPFNTSLFHKWSWGKTFKLGEDTIKNPNIIFGKDTGFYWIKLITTTDKGCKDSSLKRVYIGPDIIIFIPDAFTPDNAGPIYNDVFIPFVENYKSFEMKIYNRWGEKLYETQDINKGWDGMYLNNKSQQGVYVYKIIITSQDGKPYEFDGTVTLLR